MTLELARTADVPPMADARRDKQTLPRHVREIAMTCSDPILIPRLLALARFYEDRLAGARPERP
jgi:hypothetical protein